MIRRKSMENAVALHKTRNEGTIKLQKHEFKRDRIDGRGGGVAEMEGR